MKNEIIIASGNTGKIKEAQNILNNFQITSIKEINPDIKIETLIELFSKY